jgi:hypothetical protein
MDNYFRNLVVPRSGFPLVSFFGVFVFHLSPFVEGLSFSGISLFRSMVFHLIPESYYNQPIIMSESSHDHPLIAP